MPRIKNPRKNPHYIDKKEMLAEVIASRNQGEMTRRLSELFMILVERIASTGISTPGGRMNVSKYTFVDDMKSEALLNLSKSWRSFDPAKSSEPFGYYTQCVKNSFRQVLNTEKTHRDGRDRLLVECGLTPSFAYQDEHADDHYGDYHQEHNVKIHTEEDHDEVYE